MNNMEDNDFRMPIEEVLHIRGRGLVLAGRIESGRVSVGDIVCIETAGGELVKGNLTLDGIEVFGHITTADTGMNIGMFFKIPYLQKKSEALEVIPAKAGDIVKK